MIDSGNANHKEKHDRQEDPKETVVKDEHVWVSATHIVDGCVSAPSNVAVHVISAVDVTDHSQLLGRACRVSMISLDGVVVLDRKPA